MLSLKQVFFRIIVGILLYLYPYNIIYMLCSAEICGAPLSGTFARAFHFRCYNCWDLGCCWVHPVKWAVSNWRVWTNNGFKYMSTSAEPEMRGTVRPRWPWPQHPPHLPRLQTTSLTTSVVGIFLKKKNYNSLKFPSIFIRFVTLVPYCTCFSQPLF